MKEWNYLDTLMLIYHAEQPLLLDLCFKFAKGQLISKCLLGVIVLTKKPTKSI